MQEADRAAAIFAGAWGLYNDAIEILELGKQRIAAEVAWGATKRLRKSWIPAFAGMTGGAGMTILLQSSRRCFYLGNCSEVTDLIRGTSDYIRDAEGLASSGAGV